ncbi:hypothetical protein C2857_005678 [Epichloe festucae Fl1]|uniref:Uncharacterized protein n=1 Tax=Epichloe festucae (strain Fl1) TaxID=877507 RepID=A0A7S9KL40_EPIFF|nr:hypothetical protein C2857_005678 [Epichloe festucae Fl1]
MAESPPSERQSGKQLHETPGDGDGFGTSKVGNKNQENKSDATRLESNPKGPLDDELKKKFTKGEGNSVGANVQK